MDNNIASLSHSLAPKRHANMTFSPHNQRNMYAYTQVYIHIYALVYYMHKPPSHLAHHAKHHQHTQMTKLKHTNTEKWGESGMLRALDIVVWLT